MPHQNVDHILPDTKQTWWQLASIQCAGNTSAIFILTTVEVLQLFGWSNTLIAIVLGNLFLWAIMIAMVAMCDAERLNSLENAIRYLGRASGIIVALALVATSVFWFTLQLNFVSSGALHLLNEHLSLQPTTPIKIGLAIGIVATLLCLRGIIGIKWLSIISFPFLTLFVIYALTFVITIGVPGPQKSINFLGVIPIIMAGLTGSVDLPTFFRHSRSRSDSMKALLCIFIYTVIVQIAGALLGCFIITEPADCLLSKINPTHYMLLQKSMIFYIILSCLCINTQNLYIGSVGWEALAPNIVGKKEFLIMGLAATIVFSLIQAPDNIKKIIGIGDLFIATMGVVALSAFIAHKVNGQLIKKSHQRVYAICWLSGVLLGILSYFGIIFAEQEPLAISSAFSLIFLLTCFTSREVIRSVRQ